MIKKYFTIVFSMIALSGCVVNTTTNNKSIATPKAKSVAIEGFKLLEKGKYKDAIIKLKIADNLGHPDAPRAIGLMYIRGDGVTRNYTKAMDYLKKAYMQRDNFVAAYDIGAMYKNAEGVNKDIEKAKKYYLIAAKNDFGLAQYELAKIYAYQKNEREFMFWAKRSQKYGYKF